MKKNKRKKHRITPTRTDCTMYKQNSMCWLLQSMYGASSHVCGEYDEYDEYHHDDNVDAYDEYSDGFTRYKYTQSSGALCV